MVSQKGETIALQIDLHMETGNTGTLMLSLSMKTTMDLASGGVKPNSSYHHHHPIAPAQTEQSGY